MRTVILAAGIAYLKRCLGYTFWVGLEVLAIVGLPRLIIFPLSAHILGKEQFGLFLFSYGVVMMVAKAPSVGLSTGVIRNMADLEEPAKCRLIATALRLAKTAMLVIMAIGTIGVAIARYFWRIDIRVVFCLIPLLLMLYSWNLLELRTVRYRVERKFGLRAAWFCILGCLLLIAVLGAFLGGVVGMAWAYVLAYLITHVILWWRQKGVYEKGIYDVRMANLLKTIWLHVSVASALAFSGRYIYRVVLGISGTFSQVSILFGAINVMSLFVAPITVLSPLLLSMLASFPTVKDLGRKQKYTALFGAILAAAGGTALAFIAGPVILSVIFPEFAEESTHVLQLTLIIIPSSVITGMCRPFVEKFGPIKLLPAVNAVNLAAHLLPAATLIPLFGMKGVIVSHNIGYGVNAIAWLVALTWTLRVDSSAGPLPEGQRFTFQEKTVSHKTK